MQINGVYYPSIHKVVWIHLENQLLYLIEKYQVLILIGATGSGKTTQVPQFLVDAGWCNGYQVACTQPRRLACTSIALRVAEELGSPLGVKVGYSVKFDDKTSKSTLIKYLTDEMLFREALMDPYLSKYSVVMIDEAHERSLYTDILIGLLKKIIKKRPEFRIIVSSATLDAENFKAFFSGKSPKTGKTTDQQDIAMIYSLPGRTFPVDVYYAQEPLVNYVEEAVDTVFKIHHFEKPGDILVFLPNKDHVETVVNMITTRASE